MSTSVTECPHCSGKLRKCLIQQNFSIVICPNEECMYPFSDTDIINHIVQTNDKEILEAAKARLTNNKLLDSMGDNNTIVE
ncbi:uncharacterized protein Ecym_6403 [Eremothecium cymbalariae DBVPG|uniref:Uncharacterized protein n=1 Tax=Eremothecium cymbalariae (strain CBS 270.75 / DBVPG 7215 / KCTC 17166 / NRRL Y-17582) TaxID=931890 RepID=G8JUJ7_ERECY|nr:hypothetical protein Ecym_6403 [Eremothecium cymbalariae DBVPG\